MPNIELPDGKKLKFKEKVSGAKVAESISKSLAKEALLMSVDGDLRDLNFPSFLWLPSQKGCAWDRPQAHHE